MKLFNLAVVTISLLSASASAQVSTKEMLELGEYVTSRVEPTTLKKINKMAQCGGIAKFFDNTLSTKLVDKGLNTLKSNSDLTEETAWNYILFGSMYFVQMAIEKGYIDQNNPENQHTVSATKQLYLQMCSDLKTIDEQRKGAQLESKQTDAELKHKKNLEAAKAKAELDLERFEQDELAKKRAAELKQIEMEAAAQLKLKKEKKLKQQQLASEKRKAEAQVLAKRHHADATDCVSNDSARVKKQLLARLPEIHRPDALHVEDQKISKVKFLKDATIMEVSYTFKLFSQTKYKSGWGSKSEPNTLKSTGDIKVKPYSRSSAKATCASPST